MGDRKMSIIIKPIGYISTDADSIPINWLASDVEGVLIIEEEYLEGLGDIKPSQRIYVLYHLHLSPEFTHRNLKVKPPLRDDEVGVFSTNAPVRPNPIGLSLLKVIGIEGNTIHVKGLDMFDRTPILDIKPEHPV